MGLLEATITPATKSLRHPKFPGFKKAALSKRDGVRMDLQWNKKCTTVPEFASCCTDMVSYEIGQQQNHVEVLAKICGTILVY